MTPDTSNQADDASGIIEIENFDVSQVSYAAETVNPDTIQDVSANSNKNTVATPVSNTSNKVSSMVKNQIPDSDGEFEEWMLLKEDSTWPPPIFINPNASKREKFYLEHRWHSQWSYYDKEAAKNKVKYYNRQWIVVIGSLIIPAIVSVASTAARFIAEFVNDGAAESEAIWRMGIDFVTILISLFVAGAAAVETLNKYGENWNSYRSAAEELQAEKNYYDMQAGPYANNPNPFATFVERVEGVVANQNGKYFQAVQKQLQKQAEDNEAIVDAYLSDDDDDDGEAIYLDSSVEPTV